MANGLINLQTDLTSLKYSSMPLGSDKPLITKDIGQAPGSKIGAEISHRIDDTSRIAQMLISKPGINYLLHEAQLQQIGVGERIRKARKGGKSVAGAVLGQLGNTLVTTVKIIGSTLAQVPVNGTGTHFLKAFRTDTYLQPSGGNTRSKFAQFFGAGGVEGASAALEGKPIDGVVQTQFFKQGSTVNNGKIVNPNDSTVEPKFTYEAKVQPVGEGTLSTNEKPNASLPENDANRSSAYNSVEGTAVPVGYKKPISFGKKPIKEVGDLSPTVKRGVETTATPGVTIFQNSIKSRSNVVDSKDWTSPDSINNIGNTSFSYDSPYNQQPGSVSINNAQNGAPIPVYPSGSALRETGEYLVGSRPTTDKDWLKGEQDNLNSGNQKYNEFNTYTGNSTEYAIGNALEGEKIRTKQISGSYRPQKFAQDYQPTYQPYPDPVPISEIGEKDATEGPSTTIEDFRQKNEANLSSYSYNYNSATVHKEQRVGLGNQGKATDKTSYMTVDPDKIDQLNALDISKTRVDGTDAARDLAKFYFEIITPDNVGDGHGTFLHFRAFIDSIDDGYTADWQGRKYNGRAENFYTYGGFDRDISISFNVAAASRSEMKPLYKKMVYLASATAPTYGTSGLMRGTLAKITVGSYFAQIPGVLTSVKFTLDNNTPWEIAMGNPDGGAGNKKDDDVQELPMLLKCSISFKPIHDFAPQTGLHHYFTSPKLLNGGAPFFTDGQAI